MSIDQTLQEMFDRQTATLQADHVRELTVALHKVALAEQLANHLGLEPLSNPLVDQIKLQLPSLQAQYGLQENPTV